jgi:signal transduction histidine kinase
MKDGAGMGLAMVHGIIKSYYGVIKVNSQKGKETVFTLFLPKVKSEDNSIVHN